MMVLEILLDVQLALLHTEVNRLNLLLHRRNSLLHRAHASLVERPTPLVYKHNLHLGVEAVEQSEMFGIST
jgi:hypothetical protein